MDVAIGLPNSVPGTTGEQLNEWARRADSAGFSSLGTIDRIAYPNLDPLLALTAAASVTDRIGLLTSILIGPMRRSSALIAKQTATIQQLSGGRLTVGIAVGGREDDYEATGADFGSRGEEFDTMLSELTGYWKGEEEIAIGPDVRADQPQLLIGGTVDAAFERTAKYADGWIAGGGTPDMFAEGKKKAEAAWSEAGRDGAPKTRALAYFSLGDDAEQHANSYLKDYYAFLGEMADQIAGGAAKDADTAAGYKQAFEGVECDELVFFPCNPDPEQVDLLAAAVL
jgi:alkanesulfonate monooxygenase SsuD/methylene tetrahydromethanopterin reductase-like flavin-dependent oxidoreductase (luciferase family)